MKILVTGGLGYIGSHTTVELLQLGYDVVVVDDLSNSQLWIKDRIEAIAKRELVGFYPYDVNDAHHMKEIFEAHVINGVIHFAAFKAVGESVDFPEKYYHNNISGLINLLTLVQEYQVPSFIFSSSCTVYGNDSKNPVSEDAPVVEAFSPYGTTKILGELILKDWVKYRVTKVVLLRYFNPVGAHPSGLIGELPLGVPNNLIPFITQTASGIRKELVVYGDDYDTPDGTCIRDYIHVQDLANAHVKALEYTQKMTDKIDAFNVGTGNGNTVLEVIKTFDSVNNLSLNYRIGERRAGDVEKIWADSKKSNEVLGWNARYNLEDMMQHAWQWQCHLNELNKTN